MFLGYAPEVMTCVKIDADHDRARRENRSIYADRDKRSHVLGTQRLP
jgi:hypothetical protein